MAANERERGWGSAWSVPHSEEEKVAREQSDRLEKAVRAQDWATVAKTCARFSQPAGHAMATTTPRRSS